MGVMQIVTKASGKIGDKIAKAAALSPNQLSDVAEKRLKYLVEMPDPDDVIAKETTEKFLAANSIEVFNAYLPQISTLYAPLEKDAFDSDYNIRYFNITKWITDKKENSLEKLVNVYAVLSDETCNIALIFHRTCRLTQVYLAVTNIKNADNNRDADTYMERLQAAIKGNFPGTEFGSDSGSGIPPFLLNDIPYSVATASNIPTEKSEKFLSQTIEKLLDGIVPNKAREEYTLILLASPINDIEERKLRLSQIYSGLKPYSAWQTNFTVTELNTQGSTATVGVNVGASAGIQNGQNQSQGINKSVAQNEAESVTDQISKQKGISKAKQESATATKGKTKIQNRANQQTESQNASHADSKNQANTKGTNVNVNPSISIFGCGGSLGGACDRACYGLRNRDCCCDVCRAA